MQMSTNLESLPSRQQYLLKFGENLLTAASPYNDRFQVKESFHSPSTSTCNSYTLKLGCSPINRQPYPSTVGEGRAPWRYKKIGSFLINAVNISRSLSLPSSQIR